MAAVRKDPETKLQEVLNHYRLITKLHPAISALIQDPAWKQVFSRHICNERDVINARSPDLEDHEITIAQKAFVNLMKDGNTFHGALAIYMDELLGLNIGTGKDLERIIQDAVQVGAALLEEHDQCIDSGASVETAKAEETNDAKLARLESLCEEAEAEANLTHISRYDRANAAKFFRDTVENTINYIQRDKLAMLDQSSPSWQYYEKKLRDLEKTYKSASAAARIACYGKPRSFEKSPSKSSANLEPLGQHRTPTFKREATEPGYYYPQSDTRDYYSSSRSFPQEAPSAFRSNSRRLVSPRYMPSFKPEAEDLRRFGSTYGDCYRPARNEKAKGRSLEFYDNGRNGLR